MRLTTPELPEIAAADLPRAMHYGEFYGLKPLPADGRPLLVVHGNCQAEALRLLIQNSSESPCVSVRVPPVHELTRDEMPLYDRLLGQASVLLTQPVVDGYRGLSLGTAQVTNVAARASVVVWPVIRYAGLLPWQAVYTHPKVGNPPVVPYHDIRIALRAAGRPVTPPTRQAFRAVSDWSLAELRRREESSRAVPVSDIVAAAGAAATNTINHPGNPVLVQLARRIQERLAWPATATDPGFVLLDSVHAPVEKPVLDALVLTIGPRPWASDGWLVEGDAVSVTRVAEAQMAWYQQHPEVLTDVLDRTEEQRDLLLSVG